jgi:uncharacterized protein
MTTTVTDNADRSRYEVFSDGELAGFAEYEIRPESPQVIAFTHTETDPAFAGRGLAKALATGLLDDSRARGRAVLPFCPYIAGFIRKNPEYTDLVPADKRERFEL